MKQQQVLSLLPEKKSQIVNPSLETIKNEIKKF